MSGALKFEVLLLTQKKTKYPGFESRHWKNQFLYESFCGKHSVQRASTNFGFFWPIGEGDCWKLGQRTSTTILPKERQRVISYRAGETAFDQNVSLYLVNSAVLFKFNRVLLSKRKTFFFFQMKHVKVIFILIIHYLVSRLPIIMYRFSGTQADVIQDWDVHVGAFGYWTFRFKSETNSYCV